MDTFLGRYKNLVVLAAILFVQIIGLAVQVRRPSDEGETRLVRLWAVSAVTPFEKAAVNSREWLQNLWGTYIYLHGVRRENHDLREQISQMKLEEARMSEDARMARRIQALLRFKEQYVDSTIAAQVIGTSGTDQSRVLYIDKGANDGIKPDMAVITPTGIVGKVSQVYPDSSQVLPINDQFSGVGAALKDSRLQGILKGASNGATTLQYIMSDEKVVPGEDVITSGGDRIFPKGLAVGKVASVEPGKDLFLNIRVIPSSRLDQLEEVLVVTKITEKMPDTKDLGPLRASDILAERLPSVPNKTDLDAAGNVKPGTATGAAVAPPGTAGAAKTGATGTPTPGATGASKAGANGATANRPAGTSTTPRTTTPRAIPGTSGTVKPKPANPAGTRPIVKPSNGVSAGTSTHSATGSQSNADGTSSVPRQKKPASPSDTAKPADQSPTTPAAGTPPQP